ncbi:MAG: SufE family protein [Bacteroidetes bacterium]|nr:SufE family protein [Bacteroidota bacterium]MBU1679157.1 SufE family protein [Bacteroidota bacterium]MBU2508739.1 SufE family protein [Bacteroidota bacterium]
MTIQEAHSSIVEDFENLGDWEEKYKYIIELGRSLPAFPEDYRTAKNKIEGCQSQVWMNSKFEKGKVFFEADSDAMIVKGLIAILLKVYSGFTPDEILSTPPEFMKKIGIDNHLSLTRKNGLGAMLKQIKMYAVAFKALADRQHS